MPGQGDRFASGGDNRESIRDLIEALERTVDVVGKIRSRPPLPQPAGHKPTWWVVLLLGANLGLFAWVLETLVDVKEHVAVIECQLSDACKHVVTYGAKQ